jgi:hypothetical protein
MIAPVVFMEALADDGSVFDENASDGGIGRRQPHRLMGELEGANHPDLVPPVFGESYDV